MVGVDGLRIVMEAQRAVKFVEKLSAKLVEDNVSSRDTLKKAIDTLPEGALKSELIRNMVHYDQLFQSHLTKATSNLLHLCTAVGLEEAKENSQGVLALAMLPCCRPETFYSTALAQHSLPSTLVVRNLMEYLTVLKCLGTSIQKDSTTGGYCSLYVDTQDMLSKTAFYMHECCRLV